MTQFINFHAMKVFLSCLLGLTVSLVHGQRLALVKKDKKIGYIDTRGTWVIAPAYDKAGSFSDGLAPVFIDGKWGYINTSGEVVIDPQFDNAKAFHSGIAVVANQKKWQYIDKSGQPVELPHSDKLYDFDRNGLAFIRESDLVGLMDTKGNVVLKPLYTEIKPFEYGFAKVKRGNKWGIISPTGDAVITPEYDEIDISGNGVFVARKGTAFGVIAQNGSFKHVKDATKIWPFQEGETLTYARKEDKLGFINTQGEWVIEPQFEKARAFRNGLAPVYLDKKWGYVNAQGELVVQPEYPDAEIFSSDGLAPVKVGKEWGFIDKSGKLVIPAEYGISVAFVGFLTGGEDKGFIDGLARVKHKGKWGFIDTKGQALGNEWFDNAEPFEKAN